MPICRIVDLLLDRRRMCRIGRQMVVMRFRVEPKRNEPVLRVASRLLELLVRHLHILTNVERRTGRYPVQPFEIGNSETFSESRDSRECVSGLDAIGRASWRERGCQDV